MKTRVLVKGEEKTARPRGYGGTTYECIACGWQGIERQTDAGACPECGGETQPLDVVYGGEGIATGEG